MSSRKLSVFAVLFLLVTLIVPSLTAIQAQEKTELVIWVEGAFESNLENEGSAPWLMKHGFEAAYPGVTVIFENHGWDEELRQNLLTAFLAGNAPDIVVGENFIAQWASLGALIPIDDIVAEFEDDLVPGTYAAAVYDGSVYGLSGATGVFGFERNCAVVEAAGLDCSEAPATWDELLEEATMITEAGGGDYYGYTLQGPVGPSIGSVFRVYVYLAQAGATLCKNDCQDPYFNDPNAIPVYEFLRELNKQTPPGLTFNTDEGQVYSQLFNGVSAYQMAGTWHVSWSAESGCETCEYSTVPIPEGGIQASVVVGNVIYAILSQSDNVEVAKDWIRYYQTPEVQSAIYATGRFPTHYSALDELIASDEARDADKAFAEVMKSSELLVLPSWRNNPQAVWTVWNDMFTRILTTDDPIAEILDEAQVAAEAAAQ
jgi:multiple sugar transport system substrate-binding protein